MSALIDTAVKQHDTDHMINRLYIHWDVSTQCPFKCSYCYAMKEYNWQSDDDPGEWNKIDKWEHQKLIIKAFKRSTLPIFLGLQGGEPTIHPKYEELIELCHDAISVHEHGGLYVTTNGSRGPEFFKKQKYHDKLMFLWSFHPEYSERYGDNFYKFVESVKVCGEKGHRNRINVMLHSDEKYWPIIHKLVDMIEDIPDVEIHPHWVYKDGDPHAGTIDYNEKFYKEFERFKHYPAWLIFQDVSGNNHKLNDYDIFLSGNFNFHKWKCWHNNYEISWKGVVSKACNLGEKVSLITSPFYFKNIHTIKPVLCPHTSCACDGHLKIYKEKH